MEDALKVDADAESGLGGDDEYDAVRYGIASRPPRAETGFLEEAPGAWSPEVLALEAERTRRGLPAAPPAKRPNDLAASAGF